MEFAEFIQTSQVDNVTLYRADLQPVGGTLCITGHHIMLCNRENHSEELWLLHKSVDSIEKKLSGSAGMLTLKCKDFKIYRLQIPNAEDCINIASSVEALSNIDNITLSYPFFHRALFDIFEDGWTAFMPETEFGRVKSFTEEWRLSSVNKAFEVCPSYPQLVCVHRSINDETICRAAQFRQGGRFPVLSYYHKDNGLVMMRCSQPMTGPNGKRCKEDEMMVNAVLGIGKRGYIVDTRSTTHAKLATAKGGGVEPEAHYSQWRRLHHGIERHTVLHESLIKLMEACLDSGCSMDRWLSKLESCGWLGHVKDVLTCACVAAQCINNENASVLVHGSEGTDSTLQVTSLAQLILDPDCRTVRGFEALVEREFLQAGHPFGDRCAKSAFAQTKFKSEAPVFLLFLDCVWQIWQQFPLSFEFTEEFLIMLFTHAYASQFGTVLCNNERERKYYKIQDKTVSLWSYINRPEILTQYMNPLYEPNATVIWPSVAPQSLQLWDNLYLRWQRHSSVHCEMWEEIGEVKQTDKDVKSKVTRLRKQVAILEREALDSGLINAPRN